MRMQNCAHKPNHRLPHIREIAFPQSAKAQRAFLKAGTASQVQHAGLECKYEYPAREQEAKYARGKFFLWTHRVAFLKMSGVKFNPRKIYPLPSPDEISKYLLDSPAPLRGDWEFFASGRCALNRVILEIKKRGFRGRMFLPRYFCPEAARSISKNVKVEFFEDLPSEDSPRFETLNAAPGDAVMAVNFFGLRDMALWAEWKRLNPETILLENASHTPFSYGAADADFAFGSLRKWLPLPDGGFLSAKNPAEIFRKPASSMPDFASDFLAASLSRAQENVFSDDFAERLFYGAEAKISAITNPARMSAYSMHMLARLDVTKMAEVRYCSVRAFSLKAALGGYFEELSFSGGRNPEKFSVYCPVLRFRAAHVRDAVYAELRKEGMFAPIYWGGFGANGSAAARAESSKSMCIPPFFADSPQEAENFCEFIISLCAGV